MYLGQNTYTDGTRNIAFKNAVSAAISGTDWVAFALNIGNKVTLVADAVDRFKTRSIDDIKHAIDQLTIAKVNVPWGVKRQRVVDVITGLKAMVPGYQPQQSGVTGYQSHYDNPLLQAGPVTTLPGTDVPTANSIFQQIFGGSGPGIYVPTNNTGHGNLGTVDGNGVVLDQPTWWQKNKGKVVVYGAIGGVVAVGATIAYLALRKPTKK